MNVQEYAVIDMGSNSIRLMIGVKADDAKPWRFTPNRVMMTSLGVNRQGCHHDSVR